MKETDTSGIIWPVPGFQTSSPGDSASPDGRGKYSQVN